jgi:Reverse transcriptase (RNA-dependent DNA polymerase)/Endonuclease-reverse transcriptase
MADTTNIIHWNARSLKKKVTELVSVLQEHNAPIALISETHLVKDLKVNGYKVFQTNRPAGQKGGTAILVRPDIKHHQIKLPALHALEATAIQVTINKRPTIIVSVYNPGDLNIHDISTLLQTSLPIIIAGDLNAKHRSWHSQYNNKAGRAIFNLSQKHDFVVQGPTTFTRYPDIGKKNNTTRPDVLDIALVQNFPYHIEHHVLDKLNSDHLPVLMKIHSQLLSEPQKRRNYSKANWSKYQQHIDSFLNNKQNIKSSSDVDEAEQHLTKIIQQALEENVPLIECKQPTDKLPEDILSLIRLRNRLRKVNRFRRSNYISSQINNLRNQIDVKISNFKNEKWSNLVSNLSTDDHSAWKVTKALTRQTSRIPPLKQNNSYICDPQQKAELLANTLQESFSPNPPKDGEKIHFISTGLQVANEMSKPNDFKPKKYRPSQIKNFLKKLKRRKAPGPDDIPNEALINLPDSAVKYLTNLINAMLRIGYFPQNWKLAKVLMLPKPGKDHSDPNNYRPISLLSTLSKVAEKAILLRLNRFLHIKKLIRHEQFGFRSQHSTVHQAVRVMDDITAELNKNRPTAMLLIDLQKAFDRVWHDGLIHKLINLNVPIYITRILHSYLSSRSFYVDLNGYKSSIKPIKAGVPQGSLLGPVLFNIYINDMPSSEKTKLAIYADDTAVYASSFNPRVAFQHIQEHASTIEAWCNKWLLQVNASKCETILFRTRKRKHQCNFNFTFNGEAVQQVDSAKYLGVTLQHNLKWSQHLRATINKANGRLAQLYPLLNPRSCLQLKTALHIYKATILPVISYASPVWSGTTITLLKSLQLIQNKVVRMITKCPRYTRTVKMHSDLKLPMVNEYLATQNKRFYYKAALHSNNLISNFCNYDFSNWDKVAKQPKDACSKLIGLNFYH